MTEARYTLTCSPRPLNEAQDLADLIDTHMAIEALAVTVNEIDEAKSLWNTVAYFESLVATEEARAVLAQTEAEISSLPDVDWVRLSLEGLAPVVAGRFYLHGSHDRHRRRIGGISFEIDAGTAFGTGHHGTTAGCLLALDAILKKHRPRRIFDLGCGTGVLAIAAAKASGRHVLATDIDVEAVRVTKFNADLNGLGPQIIGQTATGLHHAVITQHAPYDLIFANILARPLANLAQGLCRLLMPGGHLVLSGLTDDQARWIKACYTARGLVVGRNIRIENWMALVMVKPGKKTNARKLGPGV